MLPSNNKVIKKELINEILKYSNTLAFQGVKGTLYLRDIDDLQDIIEQLQKMYKKTGRGYERILEN